MSVNMLTQDPDSRRPETPLMSTAPARLVELFNQVGPKLSS